MTYNGGSYSIGDRIQYENANKYDRQGQTEYLCGCTLSHNTLLSTFDPKTSDTDPRNMPALRRQAVGGHEPDARISEWGADAVEIGPRLLGAGLQRGLRRLCERARIEPGVRGR